jgi:hypothetical protein
MEYRQHLPVSNSHPLSLAFAQKQVRMLLHPRPAGEARATMRTRVFVRNANHEDAKKTRSLKTMNNRTEGSSPKDPDRFTFECASKATFFFEQVVPFV